MDPPMLRLEHYSSYVTHPSQQTSHPQQRFYMVIPLKEQSFQDHPKESIYIRSGRDSLDFKKNRKKTLTKPTEPKIYMFSKSRNKSSSFTNKQGTGPIKWTTGTVTEILKCGQSYMIQGPNSRVYRRNRAHLKPICHDSSSFQDHLVKKGRNSPKTFPFKTISPAKPNPCLSRRKPAIWTPDPSCLMNLSHIKHPQHHPHCHP